MYGVRPRGINIRDNDRLVQDGFLQESINMQWRDGAYRPIPERINYQFSNITLANTEDIIFHKVSDEDKINVLAFDNTGVLKWYGVIENGIYTPEVTPPTIAIPTITDFSSLSFTILNGLIYFMSKSQEFYYRVQFNEVDEVYEVKDMYAWKDLRYKYPAIFNPGTYNATIPQDSNTTWILTSCGVILTRITLVLNTGEEVLHSPFYANALFAFNESASVISKGDTLENIHTIINTNFEFTDTNLFEEEISAINIYASLPFYTNEVQEDVASGVSLQSIDDSLLYGEIQRLSEQPMYLIKTINSPSANENTDRLLLYQGEIDASIDYGTFIASIDLSTVAAGDVMPIDNFSYHRLFGTLTSSNGRIVTNATKTVLSTGHLLELSSTGSETFGESFRIETEDGKLEGGNYILPIAGAINRGILSYPDSRAEYIGIVADLPPTVEELRLFKCRANKAHNIACAYSPESISTGGGTIGTGVLDVSISIGPSILFTYYPSPDLTVAIPTLTDPVSYTSENRLQFSEAGEFSVWPAINSYRIGEGKIQFVGDNSIDPANADYIAPLIIGTSDGVYTVNFDVTGENLIQSISKAANMPALSPESVLIEQNLIYLSDKGLIAINSGQLTNLTKDLFPEQGNGGFPLGDTVYPNYNTLTSDFFAGPNPYILTDIIDYLKGAIFAYDGRRNNLWCSNPGENFSLVYNFVTSQWDYSTIVFTKKFDLFSLLSTAQGDIYSRYLVKDTNNSVRILSGEDPVLPVNVHMLTRPIKMTMPDQFKKIERLISRSTLVRDDVFEGFYFGLYGKQDINKNKVNIPLIAIKDDTTTAWPNNIRQDIPIGRQRGKYKTISILLGGFVLPESSIDGFEITALPVDNKIIR